MKESYDVLVETTHYKASVRPWARFKMNEVCKGWNFAGMRRKQLERWPTRRIGTQNGCERVCKSFEPYSQSYKVGYSRLRLGDICNEGDRYDTCSEMPRKLLSARYRSKFRWTGMLRHRTLIPQQLKNSCFTFDVVRTSLCYRSG